MDCGSCGHENPDQAKFCLECGAGFALRCGGCATELPVGAKFCLECGAATSTTGTVGPARDPREYTPKHLADKILQSKSALEGERKQVTVLFADVKGSMELAEQLDPEEWHRMLERFFEILTEGVHRFEGTVNQYTGDGIMALFGAPIAHEDHAQRACYAALHLQGEIAGYATEVKREHGVGFSARMGINSGEVVVGKIGDDLRMDYTAQGHTVGLAQRMEALASPDTCYLTTGTAALAGGYFELEDLGEFRVKGVTDGVQVYRLVGLGAARTRFDISRARGLSRFVGRAADMRTLEDATEQTATGNGQVVGVVAMAGTGKSRLCFEFLERCRARGMMVFEGRAVAHGKNIPFLPIFEVYRAFFGITLQDDDRSAREKIAGRMVLLDLGFAHALALTAPVVANSGDGQTALDMARRGLETARGANAALEAEASQLTSVAQAQLACGDAVAAVASCDEAIEIVERRGTWRYGPRACIVKARALLAEDGAGNAAAIRAALNRCDELCDQIGSPPHTFLAKVERANHRVAEIEQRLVQLS